MQLVLQCAHLFGCGVCTYAGSESGNYMAHVGVVFGVYLGGEGLPIWHPELDVRIRVVERPGQHANNRVRRGIEMNLLADHRSIPSEAPLKEAPREHDNVICF